MAHLSRSQILVYGAVAVALLLLGARWIKSADDHGSSPGEVSFAGSGGGGSSSVSAESGRDVVVHVAGAVRDPGVYRLPAGSRVTDAVQRAGGATRSDAVEGINLAALVTDGQQIVVPRGGAAAASSSGGDSEGPISLGSATVEELDTIEGIGPVTAQNIVEYRDEQGGLSSVEDLDEISGIGPATMESLRSALQP
ncbi:MAG TPA: ComEA family DNA-binding protein [Solirubrobacterales bacterium]|nr:ComEA family DNA-binding protein [Solirubrobacterales bacterium]